MQLEKWAEALAIRLQESLSHSDISQTLRVALGEIYPDRYCYPTDIFGNGSTGSVVFCLGSDFKQATYTIATVDGKRTCTIGVSNAIDVLPRTVYDPSADAVKEAGARNSKSDQSKLQVIHDHVVKLGAACATVESHADPFVSGGDITLCESASVLDPILLREAKADYEIKLIAPGKGSSAFYPAEVLKRDGPTTFVAGTHVYLNHATAAEEAARPEGDVKNLLGVLSGNAYYDESHRRGPGLYGHMKVFADHAQVVEEKAAHVGMSIRASGVREAGQTREGLPVLKQFIRAESVDVVTHAGAGGMILTEAARQAQQEGTDMDETAVKKLILDATAPLIAENARLKEALSKPVVKPKKVIRLMLENIRLPEAAKEEVIRNLKMIVPLTEAGLIDEVKLKPMVEAEAKRVAQLAEALGAGKVNGLGESIRPPEETAKPEERLKEAEDVFGRLAGSSTVGKVAARGRIVRVA